LTGIIHTPPVKSEKRPRCPLFRLRLSVILVINTIHSHPSCLQKMTRVIGLLDDKVIRVWAQTTIIMGQAHTMTRTMTQMIYFFDQIQQMEAQTYLRVIIITMSRVPSTVSCQIEAINHVEAGKRKAFFLARRKPGPYTSSLPYR
jgi:hypothetical protein